MCGRFDFHGDDADVAAAFGLHLPPPLATAPKFNIAPTLPACVIFAAPQGVRIAWMNFGWQKRVPQPRLVINARSETVQQRAMFRTAFDKRRCVVLAHGFYEWDKATKPRQPWYFSPAQGTLCGLAALWEPNADTSPTAVAGSFVVLTTAANDLVAPLHERMPVMLRPQEALAFVMGSSAEAASMMHAYPAEYLRGYKVTPAMNTARFDDVACIKQL